MERERSANRKLWDGWAERHVESEFYNVAAFKAGKNSLLSIERELAGEVNGLDLLHLQCHFGMDTLSWGRLGARVTGVDFSDVAIAAARKLAVEVGVPARFVCSDVYTLERELKERFDLVIATYFDFRTF